jgi:hypothetical protein
MIQVAGLDWRIHSSTTTEQRERTHTADRRTGLAVESGANCCSWASKVGVMNDMI